MEAYLEVGEVIPMTTQEKKPVNNSHRISIERLDGGYISDAGGKRRIFRDTEEIVDAIGVDKLLYNLDHAQYKLIMDFIPASEYKDYMDLIDLHKKEEENLTLDEAKCRGIIQVERFDPNFKTDLEPEKEIKVTAANCYSMTRLKSIDWKSYDEQLSLNNAEKAEICGVSKSAMYPMWTNAKKGTAKYNFAATRITMTILAKFYEKNLGIRSSTKEQNDLLKTKLLQNVRELELMCETKSFVKVKEILKLVGTMRKSLL